MAEDEVKVVDPLVVLIFPFFSLSACSLVYLFVNCHVF